MKKIKEFIKKHKLLVVVVAILFVVYLVVVQFMRDTGMSFNWLLFPNDYDYYGMPLA